MKKEKATADSAPPEGNAEKRSFRGHAQTTTDNICPDFDIHSKYGNFAGMKKLLLASAIAILIAFSSCGNSNGKVEDISWMIGTWKGTDVNTVIFSESWRREGKGFVGSGCSMSPAGDTLFKENLKIDLVEGTPYYIVTIPPKKEPVLFKMIKGDERNAIFENRDHDFPQRISYMLQENNKLTVKLEGIEKGVPKMETLSFVKSTGDNLNLQLKINTDSAKDTAPKPINIQIQ